MSTQSIAQIIGDVERSTRLRVYSKKCSIISYMYERNEALPSAILANCPLSSSAFYSFLNDLKRSGIVRDGCSRDGMSVRGYRLSAEARDLLASAYLSIDQWMRSKLSCERSDETASIQVYVENIEETLNIKYYSVEFRIVIQLYEEIEARASDLFKYRRYASTSFYYTLKRLADMGILSCSPDRGDHRAKIYMLSDHVRSALDAAHQRIVALGLLVN